MSAQRQHTTPQCTIFPAQPCSCRRQHPQLCVGEGISLPASSGLTPTFPYCQPHLPQTLWVLISWPDAFCSSGTPRCLHTLTPIPPSPRLPPAPHQGHKNTLEASSHSVADHARGNTHFPWPPSLLYPLSILTFCLCFLSFLPNPPALPSTFHDTVIVVHPHTNTWLYTG